MAYRTQPSVQYDSEGYETDFEYDEDVPEQKFNLSTSEAIHEKAARRHIRSYLPRRDGHYQLQTRKRKLHDGVDNNLYCGHHWEVDGRYHSDSDAERTRDEDFDNKPLILERTTEKLTVLAVHDAMDAEKRRRVRREARTRDRALRALAPVNQELHTLIARNEEELKVQRKEKVRDMGDTKDDMLIELTRRYNDRSLKDTIEEERERRLEMYTEITEGDPTSDKELLIRLKSLAKTSNFWAGVKDELTGAFTDLEEVHQEEEHAVEGLFLELKDEFIHSFQRATHLMKLHMVEENEKRRRVNEARAFATGRKELDRTRRQSMYHKDLVQEELCRLFAGIVHEQALQEAVTHENAVRGMDMTLEMLLHTQTSKMVDQACAEERSRRIGEVYKEMQRGGSDPLKERLKDIMFRAQEEMIISKFHGRRVIVVEEPNFHESSYGEHFEEAETEQDQRNRQLRLNSRRKSCVVADF